MSQVQAVIRSGEAVRKIFQILTERHSFRVIALPEPVDVVVASDVDYHRERYGYMRHESFSLCRFGEQIWALGLGESHGDYPADRYSCDIHALRADEKTGSAHISWRLSTFSMLYRPLITAGSNGDFYTSVEEMADVLPPRGSFLAEQKPGQGILHTADVVPDIVARITKYLSRPEEVRVTAQPRQ